MSICSHMAGSHASMPDELVQEKLLNIQNELIWGMTYRNYKENEKKKPMAPMHSPINIPFELCRAEMLLGNEHKHVHQGASKTDNVGEGDRGDGEKGSKAKPKKRKRKVQEETPSLLDRNVWPQKKYMNYLSRPNPKLYEEPKPKKYKKRCELEPCPPRFIQLAVPNKRRVYANWKDYEHLLPAEMLMRFDDILHTDQNLEPREARYYYKKLDKQKRKALRAKRRLVKKKRQEKEKDSNWMKVQIDILAQLILDYVKDEPLFTLNYKQLLLSDGILDRLEQTKSLKKPSRTTKNHFKKTIIETSDKFAIWIDTLTRFVDIQAIESEEDIPPLSISSLSEEGEEGEEEESSEYESSDEGEASDGRWIGEGEDESGWEVSGSEDEVPSTEGEQGGLGGIHGEDGDTEHELGFDDDLLEKLIKILSNCPEDFLEGYIDEERMPGVRYIDVLDKLKKLKEQLATEGPRKSFLEKTMLDWAIRNEPDNVDDPMVDKIRQVACMLGDFFGAKEPGGPGGIEIGEEGDEQGQEGAEDEEGEEGEEGTGVEGQDGEEGTGVEGQEGEEGPGYGGEEGEQGEGGEQAGEGDEEIPGGGDIGDESEGESTYDLTPAGVDEGEGGGMGIGGSKETLPGGVPDLDEEPGIVDEYPGMEGEGGGFEEEFEIEIEEGGEGEYIYPPKDQEKVPGGPDLDGKWIKGHKPSKVFEHSPDTVCCLSLKTWAVWLLEITHNAHNWTQWMSCVIQKVREYASIVRGDVKDANGQIKVLKKAEWRKFIAETEESVVAWRQYSAHVKDLSQSIVENFHGKAVNCCPKCLQDHLITNVVVAHDTLQALTEAISCAAYWQRCLDNLVDKTCGLTKPKDDDDELTLSEESYEDVDIEEIEESDESVYEIEGLEQNESPKK